MTPTDDFGPDTPGRLFVLAFATFRLGDTRTSEFVRERLLDEYGCDVRFTEQALVVRGRTKDKEQDE